MIVGVCSIELGLPESFSLKDKRAILKSLMARLRHEFNIAIAEVDYQDKWHTASLAAVTVSTDRTYAHGLFQKLLSWIERQRPDVEVTRVDIEWL